MIHFDHAPHHGRLNLLNEISAVNPSFVFRARLFSHYGQQYHYIIFVANAILGVAVAAFVVP
jgi:hypothetical protein